jgi:hypothetical protein
MAEKYKIEVNLDLPRHQAGDRTLTGIQPGGRLEGEMILTPYEDVNCRGVWLEIGYNEGGFGSPHEERMVEAKIFEGNLKKNVPVAHQIIFQVPENAPMSYHGEYVKIEWYVRARIDIPLWFDKREEFHFNVIPKLVTSREEGERPAGDEMMSVPPELAQMMRETGLS